MSATSTRRTCVVCHADLPLDRFYASGHGNGRRRTCIACVRHQDDDKRRARGARRRHDRHNARGEVWCNRCQRYLPSFSFKRHPNRPHTWWSYCRACTRDIDRERYAKKTSTLEGAERELAKRYARKQRMTRRRDQRRRAFVANSILLLRRRGLTKADICRLADVSFGSLLAWERQARRLTPAVEERFVVVVRETGHLLAQPKPAYRRRQRHPELEQLLARCLPEVRRIPIRNSWKNGRRAT